MIVIRIACFMTKFTERTKVQIEKRLRRDIHRMLRKDAQNGKSPRNSRPFETTVLIVALEYRGRQRGRRERAGEGGGLIRMKLQGRGQRRKVHGR